MVAVDNNRLGEKGKSAKDLGLGNHHSTKRECNTQGKVVELTSNPLALLFQAMGIKPIQAPKLDL